MTAGAAVFRRELASTFRTPVGWAVLALFLALQGIVFWLYVQFLARPDAPPGGVMEFVLGRTMLFWVAMALLMSAGAMWQARRATPHDGDNDNNNLIPQGTA